MSYVTKYRPDPNAIYPNEATRRVCFIKNVVARPNIQTGDYTYNDDPDGAERFLQYSIDLFLRSDDFLKRYMCLDVGRFTFGASAILMTATSETRIPRSFAKAATWLEPALHGNITIF